MPLKDEEFQDHNDQRYDKHKKREAVDPVHVFHPLRAWLIRITLSDVEVLRYLFPDAHIAKLRSYRE
jgi:hypothetical protein